MQGYAHVFMAVGLALGLGLATAPDAGLAAGGGDSGGSDKATAGAKSELTAANKKIAETDYAGAIALLSKLIEAAPNDADALNLIGYSHRKLGDRDTALTFYLKALAAEPEHRGANEYLGELYLEMGDVAKAEERLKVLDRACFFGCEEYTDLKKAIAAYKASS
ncbi:MAG: tetratricopeptide repeat protein [Dongiaceae bacterium]